MPRSPHAPASSARAVGGGLRAGLRRRRLRDRSRRAWQLAPLVAVAAVAIAALSPWVGWPRWAAVVVLATGALSLLVHVALAFRLPGVSDRLASALDHDAGLDGELRSASWFAARSDRDEWAEEHVGRAARRLDAVEWRRVYPPVAPGRSGLATVALTVAAVALAMLLPGQRVDPAAASSVPGTGQPSDATMRIAERLPPELLRQLEQLLAAAEAGDRVATEALSSNASLREMLSGLASAQDRQLLDALARAMAGSSTDQQAIDAMEALAERFRQAADAAGMSAAMQEALDALADELEIATPERGAGSAAAAADASAREEGRTGGAAAGFEQLTIQFVEDASAAGGAGVMILSQGGDEGGDAPGAGVGGSPSGEIAPGTMTDIEVALGRDVVEAHRDAPGLGVESEQPRQTEQGRAEAAFTRGAAAAFGQTPLVSTPPVPEAERSGVRHYFVRAP